MGRGACIVGTPRLDPRLDVPQKRLFLTLKSKTFVQLSDFPGQIPKQNLWDSIRGHFRDAWLKGKVCVTFLNGDGS